MRTLLAVSLALAVSLPARAQAPGIYAEQSLTIGDVTVRRIRDTVTGAVCYLAVSAQYPVALSCIPAVPSFQPFPDPYKEKLRTP